MEEAWSAVLGAIVDGPAAWSTAADVAAILTWEFETANEVLHDLSLNWMAERWDRPGAEAWTLTPLAAEGLNVCLIEDHFSGRLRWRRGEPPPRRARRPGGPGVDPVDVPDPAPGPEELAEAAEAAARWRPRGPLDPDRLPRPTVVLTGSRSTWDEAPAPVAGRRRGKGPKVPFHCSACRGAKLKPSVYCGRCCRWGFDGLVAAHRRAAAAAARAKEKEAG